MFDINSLALESKAKIYLTPPAAKTENERIYASQEDQKNGANPFYIEVYGNHTKEFKDYVRKAAILEQKNNDNEKSKDLTIEDYEVADEKSAELIASLCCGAYFVFNGKEFEPKKKNFIELFSNESFVWILEQVRKGIADRANFIKS